MNLAHTSQGLSVRSFEALDARTFRVEERLRDGTAVTFRAMRPDDRDHVREAYSRLSPEAIYMRAFRYKKELSERELTRLTDVDFGREVALVVTVGAAAEETVIAGGRYMCTDETAAEVAFTVDERYRGQGIAGRLLKHLAAIARGRGIVRFDAEVLANNQPMLAVFERSGLSMERRREGSVVHVELAL
jgi:GNAT superfamily N-acetyltransferase